MLFLGDYRGVSIVKLYDQCPTLKGRAYIKIQWSTTHQEQKS